MAVLALSKEKKEGGLLNSVGLYEDRISVLVLPLLCVVEFANT